MFDMNRADQIEACENNLKRQVIDHIEVCRKRIPEFVDATYMWPGAIRLNGAAWSADVLVAPFNFLMGFPNFALRMLAVLFDLFGAHKVARRLRRSHLGIPTKVQKRLTAKLMTELLELRANREDVADPVLRLLADAAREPLRIYVQTRNVAADITAGTLAAIFGVALLHQFTPGSISAGSAVAHLVAREQAVSEFALGEVIGRAYYALFPINPSLTLIAVTLLLVMVTIAIIAAFSGIIHDPIQALTGIHQRRLSQLLDAIEESINKPTGKGYRPKDTFLGRIYDMVDWVKGLLSF